MVACCWCPERGIGKLCSTQARPAFLACTLQGKAFLDLLFLVLLFVVLLLAILLRSGLLLRLRSNFPHAFPTALVLDEVLRGFEHVCLLVVAAAAVTLLDVFDCQLFTFDTTSYLL